MTRKKRAAAVPYFIFTPETITLAQLALGTFELALQHTEEQASQVAFAEETLQEVKHKLDAMQASTGALGLTTFDANEKIVLAAAIQLYTLDLLATPASAQRERALKRCQRLARFAQNTLTRD